MDLTPHVDRVRRELLVAAEAAGEEGRVLAERLAAPLDSALRLTLLNVLSTAADEITRDLAPGSVDLRLRGLDPSFVVTAPPVERWDERTPGATASTMAPSMAPSVASPSTAEDDGATARINFRPPEFLKARIEEAAAREGVSVNAWLVRAVSGVLGSSRPEPQSTSGGQSYTGWVR